MADLAKYGKVEYWFSGTHAAQERVNARLSEGWDLIVAKVVEEQYRVDHDDKSRDYIAKRGVTYFILGLPRNHKSPEERAASRKLREDLDR